MKRSTSALRDAIPMRGRANGSAAALVCRRTRQSLTPVGFMARLNRCPSPRLVPRIGPGVTIATTACKPATVTASQATTFQRRDSSRPFGNSRKNSGSPPSRARYNGQNWNHATKVAAGSDPGAVWSPRMAYSDPTNEIALFKPTAARIQPIGFLGWRAAISAPIVVYASPGRKTEGTTTNEAPPSVERLGNRSSSPAAVKRRATPQIHKASRRAVGALMRPALGCGRAHDPAPTCRRRVREPQSDDRRVPPAGQRCSASLSPAGRATGRSQPHRRSLRKPVRRRGPQYGFAHESLWRATPRSGALRDNRSRPRPPPLRDTVPSWSLRRRRGGETARLGREWRTPIPAREGSVDRCGAAPRAASRAPGW